MLVWRGSARSRSALGGRRTRDVQRAGRAGPRLGRSGHRSRACARARSTLGPWLLKEERGGPAPRGACVGAFHLGACVGGGHRWTPKGSAACDHLTPGPSRASPACRFAQVLGEHMPADLSIGLKSLQHGSPSHLQCGGAWSQRCATAHRALRPCCFHSARRPGSGLGGCRGFEGPRKWPRRPGRALARSRLA